MNKKEIIQFFDAHANAWDEDMICDTDVVERILTNAEVTDRCDVLDVACGTGVMIPFYLERSVRSVTAVDISKKMIDIAKGKFLQENVRFILGDIESVALESDFNAVVVYNAFPHFTDQKKLLRSLTARLRPKGTLTIAHGMSKKQIDAIHANIPAEISAILPEAEKLADMMAEELEIIAVISDDKMYQVTGRLK